MPQGRGPASFRGHRAITADGMEGLPGAASHCVSREPSPAPAPSRLGPHAFSFLETTTVLRTAGAVWGWGGTPRGWHHTKPCSPGLRKANLQEGCPGLGGPGGISELLLAVTVTWVWSHLSEAPRPPPDNGPCLSGGTEGHGGGVGGRVVAAPLSRTAPRHTARRRQGQAYPGGGGAISRHPQTRRGAPCADCPVSSSGRSSEAGAVSSPFCGWGDGRAAAEVGSEPRPQSLSVGPLTPAP